jgi:hypothetical protein
VSSVHDTITETIRDNLDLNDNITGDQPFEGAIDPDELAAEIIAALESRGFVVRKQVEPPPLRQEWAWSWPNGSARGVPGYGYSVDSAEEALAESGVHDPRNANVVTRFVSEWQQVEP